MHKMALCSVYAILALLQLWSATAVEYEMDGTAYIVYTFPEGSRRSNDEISTIHMLFRTPRPSGILLHARGTNGDFVTLEIVRGKLRYASVYDGGSPRPGYQDMLIGDDMGDNQWHQLDIERHGNYVIVWLDITKRHISGNQRRNFLKIDRDIHVARLPLPRVETNSTLLPPISLTGEPFQGCMINVTYDHVNILKAARQKSKNVHVSGNIGRGCPKDEKFFPSATMTKPWSFVAVNENPERVSRLRLKFRTFDQTGVLVHQKFVKSGSLLVELISGELWLTYSSDSFVTRVKVGSVSSQSGLWYQISLNFTNGGGCDLRINDKPKRKVSNLFPGFDPIMENSLVTMGSKLKQWSSLMGCVKEIYLNDGIVDIEDVATGGVEMDQCYLIDRCYVNPCKNNGHCLQQNGTRWCDCSQTQYSGKLCQKRIALLKSSTTLPSNNQSLPKITPPSNSNLNESESENASKIRATKPTNHDSVTSTTTPVLNSTTVLQASTETLRPERSSTIHTRPINTTHVYSKPRLHTVAPVKASPMSTSVVSPRRSSTLPINTTISFFGRNMTTRHSVTPTTTLIASTSVVDHIAVGPTTQQPPLIVVVKEEKELPRNGTKTDQILLYIFMTIMFLLFVALIIVLTMKVGYFRKCDLLEKCGRREPLAYRDSVEVNDEEKAKITNSSNDSGIEGTDSAPSSSCDSTEVDMGDDGYAAATSAGGNVDPAGFLVLQEVPTVYTQETFGWELLDGTIPRLSRISANNLTRETDFTSEEARLTPQDSTDTQSENGEPAFTDRQGGYRKLSDSCKDIK